MASPKERAQASPLPRLWRLGTGLTTILGFPKMRIPSKHDMEGCHVRT
jgi:hypothetical protein